MKRKRILIIFAALACLSFVAFFYFRSSMIEKGLESYKLTGRFDNEALKKAKEMGSEYATALLMLSYSVEEDSLRASELSSELMESSDWRIIALRNHYSNETNQINKVKDGIEAAVKEGDWFWTHLKAIFQFNGQNGYNEDNIQATLTEKIAADLGCVSAMKNYAFNTDNLTDKCKYFKMVINSEYRSKEILAEVYSKLAELTDKGLGCDKDDNLYFKYASKAAELGSAEGCLILGKAYFDGKGVAKDDEKSFSNFLKAVELGQEGSTASKYGNYYLAKCYSSGKGVKSDDSKYQEHLKKAAELGCKEAIDERNQTASRTNYGLQRICKCCGRTYDPKYGWGYNSSNGPYRYGSSNQLGLLYLGAAFFGNTDKYTGIKYCRNQCAWDCQ
jgi:TPR repeat protein